MKFRQNVVLQQFMVI